MAPKDRTRARHRWRIASLVVFLAGLGLFAAFPWVLGLTFARHLLEARASAILAPSSVEFAAIRLSWFQPTELTRVVLHNDRGDRLLVAPRAIFQWSLWQIVFDRPRSATLRLPDGELDIERRADGTVDLYETLKPIIREHPDRQLIIKVEHGRLRFRDPALAEPVVADTADIVLDLAVDPQPIGWSIVLARSRAGREPGRLELNGSYNRSDLGAANHGDATISLTAAQWPWVVVASGIEARGELDGTIDAQRRSAHWRLSGDATLTNLVATGIEPPSHSIRLDTIRAAWKVDGDDALWTTQGLELSTPLASVAGDGSIPPGPPGGDWLAGELSLALDGRYAPPTDRLEIGALTVTTPYARLGGSGTIDKLTSRPQIDLKGLLEPDWSFLHSVLVRAVEPNARIAGRPRGWRLAGTIAQPAEPEPFGGLHGELGIHLEALDLFGMRLGETAVVIRAEEGRLRFDPIDATLNQGTLHLEPQWVRDHHGSFRLRFGPSSTLKDAVINDEVSHRVLSYAAPVLDGATRVEGRVSVKRIDADFPVFDKAEVPARIEGDVLFDEVRFLPGPLANALLSLVPNERRPSLVLRDPISLRISDRKVYQEGLVIPLGRVGSVGLEGSVDFDKNLDLVARFTAIPPGTDMPLLGSILRTARFELPIRGTLRNPKIDAQAMKERLKSLGSDLLESSVAAGADGLLRLLERLPVRRQARKPPSGPAEAEQPEPPRPRTLEERQRLRRDRRRERVEEKTRRRLKRGQPPD